MKFLLCSLLLGLQAPVIADQINPGSDPSAVEEVVVSGMRTGPRLWRVSQGSHVLWLMGTTRTLPKEVTWDTHDIEQVLAGSSALISDVKLDATPGIFSMLPLYLDYRKLIRLPKGETLRDWLTPESYERYQQLQQRYAPKENLDDYRPLYAAAQLWRAARRSAGLSERVNVQKQVLKLARRHDVTVQELELDVDKPARTLREVMADFNALPRSREVACFDATLTTLQADVHVLRTFANAWAMGDVETLRRLRAGAQTACWEAVASSGRIEQLTRQMDDQWLAAVTDALAKHAQSVALRDMTFLLGDDGLLNRLRRAGYDVQGP